MKVTMWLSKNDDVRPRTEAGKQLLTDLVEKEPRVRSGSFSASSSGQCLRRQFLAYLGAKPDFEPSASLRAVFHDGHFRHLRWQIMLLNAGIIDVVEKRFDNPDYMLVGSVDGLNSEEGWIFELKGTSQFSSIQKHGVMTNHLRQIHAYFLLTGLDRAIIVYENKTNQSFEEFEVNKNIDIMDDVEYEYASLTDHALDSTFPLMLEACKNKEGPDYNSCPFSESCPNAETLYEVKLANEK